MAGATKLGEPNTCTSCGSADVRTSDSRPWRPDTTRDQVPDWVPCNHPRRLKECKSCGHTWRTYEVPLSAFVAAKEKIRKQVLRDLVLALGVGEVHSAVSAEIDDHIKKIEAAK